MINYILRESRILVTEGENTINKYCVIQLCVSDKVLALAEISTSGNLWVFQRIYVDSEHRARGYGSDVLKKLTDYLDINKIDLYANIYSSGSLSDQQLEAWYKRNGFVDSKDISYQLARYSR